MTVRSGDLVDGVGSTHHDVAEVDTTCPFEEGACLVMDGPFELVEVDGVNRQRLLRGECTNSQPYLVVPTFGRQLP